MHCEVDDLRREMFQQTNNAYITFHLSFADVACLSMTVTSAGAQSGSGNKKHTHKTQPFIHCTQNDTYGEKPESLAVLYL